jgi:hypothetical protein
MPSVPPETLINLIHKIISDLLSENPAATSAEAYVQNHIEFAIVDEPVVPRYYLRIGINYHGQKVQHIQVDDVTGKLMGWNENGDALGTGANAKLLLANHTIFPRFDNEHLMSDTKIGGGSIPNNTHIRIEFKVRGWLGKTKNLDGSQLEKDIDLLKQDQADLLVICLSETAHRKWRGEGPPHQVLRRTGCERFLPLLVSVDDLHTTQIQQRDIDYEEQKWTVSSQRVVGSPSSKMPGAEHFITLCWRRE